jgi:chemotaxis protein CheD
MTEEPMVMPRIHLQPAAAVVTDKPTMVHTVLGSCVAVTMRVARLGLAAAAHCLLPNAGAPAAALEEAEALRFVDTTIELMLGDFTRRGASLQEIEVKLFGGADNMGEGGYQVGSRNVEAALAALAASGTMPAASSVGGTHGRTIDFNTATGEVAVRRLPMRGARRPA